MKVIRYGVVEWERIEEKDGEGIEMGWWWWWWIREEPRKCDPTRVEEVAGADGGARGGARGGGSA